MCFSNALFWRNILFYYYNFFNLHILDEESEREEEDENNNNDPALALLFDDFLGADGNYISLPTIFFYKWWLHTILQPETQMVTEEMQETILQPEIQMVTQEMQETILQPEIQMVTQEMEETILRPEMQFDMDEDLFNGPDEVEQNMFDLIMRPDSL